MDLVLAIGKSKYLNSRSIADPSAHTYLMCCFLSFHDTKVYGRITKYSLHLWCYTNLSAKLEAKSLMNSYSREVAKYSEHNFLIRHLIEVIQVSLQSQRPYDATQLK